MQLEWYVIAVLLGVALLMVWRQCRTHSAKLWLCAAALLVLTGSVARARYLKRSDAATSEFRSKLPHPEGKEYVRSETCRSCHPDQYASWHRSFHRTMTQVATPETVRGNFNNLVLNYEGDDHRVTRTGDVFWAELVDPDWKLVFALKKRDFENGVLKSAPIWPEQRPKVWKRIDML